MGDFMEKVDVIIIGAGVVGLAIAAQLSQKHSNFSIALLEQHDKFGKETSSRNSEVIHAGLYYPTGSLKAKLCVDGNEKLYEFCERYAVPYQRIGKLIIARSENETSALNIILNQGRKNGVQGLQLLDKRQLFKLEPNVNAIAGILSSSTGIIDSHSFMSRLEWIALKQGTIIAYNHKVVKVEKSEDGYEVYYQVQGRKLELVSSNWLINSAGLNSDHIPSSLELDIERLGYRIYPCKGEYFGVSNKKSSLVNKLIYPPPLENLKGLGIHATKTLDGRLRLGPNAFYVDRLDYNINTDHVKEFYEAVKTYMPFLEITDLYPDMAGIRPKIQGPGDNFRDFIVRHEVDYGFEGLINLIGIESPGLTSSLSLAEMVSDLIA